MRYINLHFTYLLYFIEQAAVPADDYDDKPDVEIETVEPRQDIIHDDYHDDDNDDDDDEVGEVPEQHSAVVVRWPESTDAAY